MNNSESNLPVNPQGISFEDWAALLTNGAMPNSAGLTVPELAPEPPAPVQSVAEPVIPVPVWPAAEADFAPVAAAEPPYPPYSDAALSPWDLPGAGPVPEALAVPSVVGGSAEEDAAAKLEASWRAILGQDAALAEGAEPAVAVPAPIPAEAPTASTQGTSFEDLLAWSTERQEPAAEQPSNVAVDNPMTEVLPTQLPVTEVLPTQSFEHPVFSPPSIAEFAAVAPAVLAQPPTIEDDATESAPRTHAVPSAVPTGRRAAAPLPAPVPTTEAASVIDEPVDDSTMTESERRALAGAAPELVEALRQVLLQKASDMHLTVNAPPMLRVDGGLRPAGSSEPWDNERISSALLSLLTPAQEKTFERELELDFAFTISANARFRVNYYKQRGSMGAAFRIIPTEIKQLGELGVPESVGMFSSLPRGLVLVTGPTGSGKSTTLAAMIDLVNRTRADHIVTVEDPIEFLHTHKKSVVNQREVRQDTHSFGSALKHVLRQDPDVILIGELRDLETISVALTAAETGHLVFATLHTQDAPQTIDRVIDVFPPHQQGQVRAQLAATLQGVVCQTLVKHARGTGRVVATEVLVTTPAIANLIREGKTYQIASMMQAGREQGMHTMDQHLADLVNAGKITRRSAEDKAHDREGLDRLISRTESPTEASARAIAESGIDFGDSYSTARR